MNKKIYYIALGVCFLLSLLAGWVLRVELNQCAVSVCDLVIFTCAIVVGPLGGILAGAGSILGELIAGQFASAVATLIVGIVEGATCAYLYKYAFRSKSILFGKIVSVAVAFVLASLVCLAGEWLVAMDWTVALTAFGIKTVARLVMAVACVLILPSIPHIFDEERYNKDVNG